MSTFLQHAADVCCSAVAGRGSYGSVYKAQVRGTQEVVAVKVIPLGDKDEVLEIQKEIEMLKECNHPNVVRYLVCYDAVSQYCLTTASPEIGNNDSSLVACTISLCQYTLSRDVHDSLTLVHILTQSWLCTDSTGSSSLASVI